MSKQEEKAVNSPNLFPDILSLIENKSGRVLTNHFNNHGNFRFFSYGSNMNDKDFTERMLEKAKNHNKSLNREGACLQNAKKCTLIGYKRSLKNRSRDNGAAYTIHRNEKRKVEGICHDITPNALEPFLWKEGVLSTRERTERKYKLVEKTVVEEKEPVLVLIGIKSVKLNDLNSDDLQSAIKYVKKCISGAIHFEVNRKDMLSTLKYLESLKPKGVLKK